MSGTFKSGFTLIEVAVAVAIFALAATVIIPYLGWKDPKRDREQFITGLNSMLQRVVSDTLATNTLHKIVFDVTGRQIEVQQEIKKRDGSGQMIFERSKRPYAQKLLRIPASFDFKNFYVEGQDEAVRYGAGGSLKQVWFYVVPQGLAQSVTINIIDRKDIKKYAKGQPVGLVLNPISVQFHEYDAFQQ